tara:strand:+ start:1625 stop:2062 length:438 start_codon:yes stop_codon:yes gene_type:complete
MQTCTKCHQEKEYSEFYWRSDNKSYRSACKSCQNKKSSERWKTDEDFRKRGYKRSREHQLKARYGITESDYLTLIEKAGGCCQICGTDKCDTGNKLSVDHCHETGDVRGILCRACNTGIGHLKDSPDLLREAIRYLGETNEDSGM